MTTPLIMLALLVIPVLLAWGLRRFGLRVSHETAGATGLVLVFLLTASGHFASTQAMAEMLPSFVPARVPLVYLTGVLELLIAIGIAVPATRRVTGMIAIATLVLFFPANIYAALNHVPFGGHAWGPSYLLIRAPLQALLIGWTWWFTVRRAPAPEAMPARGSLTPASSTRP